MPRVLDTLRRTSLLTRLNIQEALLERQEGLSAAGLVAAFLIAVAVVALRDPALFTHAQFYSEDGALWYADAYNTGWLHSLTVQAGGYLNTLQRLLIGPALLVPFHLAPLLCNLAGLLIQCVPVPILLSARCRNWAPLPTRLLMAAIYLVIPNAREIHVVLTNSQWHLAVAIPLLAFAYPPRGWAGRMLDITLLLLAGFCGPFCILILPLTAIFWWKKRYPWTLAAIGLMLTGTLTQISLILHHPGDRSLGALGATVPLFLRMLGADIFTAALFGNLAFKLALPMPFILAAVACGMAVLIYAMLRAPLPLRLFIVYATAMLASALHSPLITGPKPLWQLLVGIPGGRYWFFPMLAFVWSALWCIRQAPARAFRVTGAGILLAMTVGILISFRYVPFAPDYFPADLAKMRAAAPGEQITMPVYPIHVAMTITKKGPAGTDR